MDLSEMRCGVLLASEDAGWLAAGGEAVVLSGAVVLARCGDAVSLLAHARAGLADVALIDPRMAGLDRDVVGRLRRQEVSVAVVAALDFERALDAAASARPVVGGPCHGVIGVFGAKGAPGATTLVAALARALPDMIALGLDPAGDDLAQILGEQDGKRVSAPAWAGWADHIAAGDVGMVLDDLRRLRPCIVDGGRLDGATEVVTAILRCADPIVLISGADPVSLRHATQALDTLAGCPATTIVVVNRWRSTLGYGRADVVELLGARGSSIEVEFVDDLPVAADRAHRCGLTLFESAEAGARAALLRLALRLASGAEQQDEPGRRVQEHQDRDRHARRRPWRIR